MDSCRVEVTNDLIQQRICEPRTEIDFDYYENEVSLTIPEALRLCAMTIPQGTIHILRKHLYSKKS